MILRSRFEDTAGHSLWYSTGALDLYRSELTAFYNVDSLGHAANPFFGEEWRPAPMVANESNPAADEWTVDVTQASRYRVVAKVGSFWTEIESAPFDEGMTMLVMPGATEVELLLDRRPLDTADFNGDGLVDTSDYALWRETLGSTVDLRADANGDQVVDALDLAAWRDDFGETPSNANATPEPVGAAALLCLIGTGLATRRR